MRGGLLHIIEALESRRLLSAVYPTAYEQYMIELYNRARQDPSAAAARYGVALNEGPTAIPISTDPKQPLAINPLLNDSSRSYAQYIIDHNAVFSHTADGRTWQQRIAAAGYSATDSTESAGYSAGFIADTTSVVSQQVAGYFTDGGVDGRWHRINMMNAAMKEVGSGIASGTYQGMAGLISVQDLAYSGSTSFLTGVAYTDSSHDNFYTPGEQMGGVTITAVRNSDNATFSTTTWDSGGYSLALPSGTYTIWAGGGTLGGFVKYDSLAIGSQNVKRDFRPDFVNSNTGPNAGNNGGGGGGAQFAHVVGSVLTITGTISADTINVEISGSNYVVTLDGDPLSFASRDFASIRVDAGNGNDSVDLSAVSTKASSLAGGSGNDTIVGTNGNDTIDGGAGNDSLSGLNGNDRMLGGAGNDQLLAGSKNDRLYGQDGNDSLWGQNGNDTLDGGSGADLITGGKDIDTADYSSRTAALYLEFSSKYSATTGKSGQAGERDNLLDDVENVNGGGGADRIMGSNFANTIHGNAGNDTIYGMNGIDVLYGDAGNDRFFIGGGDKTRDSAYGGAGRDTAGGTDAADILDSIESKS